MKFDEFVLEYSNSLNNTEIDNNLIEIFDKETLIVKIELLRNYNNILNAKYLSNSNLYEFVLYNFNIKHSLNNEIFHPCDNYKLIKNEQGYVISYEFNLKTVFKKIALYKLRN